MDSPEIDYVPNFLDAPDEIFRSIVNETTWDDRMRARRTASFGVAYNYSGIDYPDSAMPSIIQIMGSRVGVIVGHAVNNCLANYYPDGESSMGYHSDALDSLSPEGRIAIVSLGSPRRIHFRRAGDRQRMFDWLLENGSLLVMAPSVQRDWKHAIPKDPSAGPRISLTFRLIVSHATK